MSVSPELLDIRDINKMEAEAALRKVAAEHADSQLEAEAALRKVKTFIMNAELYREQATETILQIFRVVNGYVVKTESETETICDEAMDENVAALNMQQQQEQHVAASAAESSSSIEITAMRAPGTCFAVEGL